MVDPGRPDSPGETHRYEVDSGAYAVAMTVGGQRYGETLNVPDGDGGYRAIYDLSGVGRYLSISMGYGAVQTRTTPIGEGQRFIVYPFQSMLDFNERFPDSTQTFSDRGSALQNICHVDIVSGRVPCMD